MKEVILYKQNPLTGDWLCWIPNNSYACYYPTKRMAKKFCDKFNKAFDIGKIKFDSKGNIVKVN